MKATDMLKKQHREVESLFRDALNTEDADKRAELAEEIAVRLSLHAAIEEEIFYPAFREVVGTKKGEELTLEAYEEHRVVKMLVAELPDLEPDAENFEARITVLKELVEHHVEEEEGEMFPAAEKKLGKDRLAQLGAEMETRLAELEDEDGVDDEDDEDEDDR